MIKLPAVVLGILKFNFKLVIAKVQGKYFPKTALNKNL